MKLRLRHHETRETLKLELADTGTLHDLRRQINPTAPSAVHLSVNRKDELLAPSQEDTLRSLGVTSGDLIYYSVDLSAFLASVQGGESSDWTLGDYETLGQESERTKEIVHDSMGIGFAEVDVVQDQAKSDLNPGVEDPAERSTGGNSGTEGPEPMDVEQLDVEVAAAGSKRLSVPFFLKNILVEKCGDTSELTSLVLSVHAVMLESGFVLIDSGSGKFSFSEELLSVSLWYTLPELITRSDTNTMESVTVKFQNLGHMVVVYGNLGGSSVHRVHLDKHRFVPVIDLVMDKLKFDKEGSSSIFREVFMFWRMVKDGLVIPLLIGLCDKAGLESPPCLMRLPTELKLKILESLPGVSIGNMACVCTEMQYLASDNDLWKQKFLEEAENKFKTLTEIGDSVDWKRQFAGFWWQKKRLKLSAGIIPQINRDPRDIRSQIIQDRRFAWFNRDCLYGSIGIHPVQLGRGIGRQRLGGRGLGVRAWGQSFTPSCNLGRRD